jgi:hypothetical protein
MQSDGALFFGRGSPGVFQGEFPQTLAFFVLLTIGSTRQVTNFVTRPIFA